MTIFRTDNVFQMALMSAHVVRRILVSEDNAAAKPDIVDLEKTITRMECVFPVEVTIVNVDVTPTIPHVLKGNAAPRLVSAAAVKIHIFSKTDNVFLMASQNVRVTSTIRVLLANVAVNTDIVVLDKSTSKTNNVFQMEPNTNVIVDPTQVVLYVLQVNAALNGAFVAIQSLSGKMDSVFLMASKNVPVMLTTFVPVTNVAVKVDTAVLATIIRSRENASFIRFKAMST